MQPAEANATRAARGLSGRLASSFASVADLWHHRIESTPDSEAMSWREGGRWQTMTWELAGRRVRDIANGLLALGLNPEDRCCIIGETTVAWVLVDLGVVCAGGATTTVFPSTPAEDCLYILEDSRAVVAFVDDDIQVAKLLADPERSQELRQIVTFDTTRSDDPRVVSLAEFEAAGRRWAAEHPDGYREASSAITPDRLATLMYTSGTTGRPKGVMLTHDAWVYESEAIDQMAILTPADKQLLFLPLSHVFAKVLQMIFIRLGIPTAIDGSLVDLSANVTAVQPTYLGAVPRIFEKGYDTIHREAEARGPASYRLFQWATGVGLEMSRVRQAKRRPRRSLRARYALADRLVLQRIREQFGEQVRFLISGGAPLSPRIAEFYHAIGLLVLEGYGLTESSAASCINHPDDFIFGTVGQPIPGCEVRIAEDGEILLRSRGVMKGYHNLPEETAAQLTDDGWLRTGDIGQILPSGHVKITDRKKDLIITAGGKNIAPANFQNRLKATCPHVAHVVMLGDSQRYCVALVGLDVESLGAWARGEGLSTTNYESLVAKPQVHDLIWSFVEEVNRSLPPYETVKKIAMLPEPLTVASGTLTPSLKVKRREVARRFAELVESLYETPPKRSKR